MSGSTLSQNYLLILLTGIILLFTQSNIKASILNDSLNSCNGTLGENIFTDGDFGSGSANILPTNPNIAPGYTYTTNTPPSDGFYTITNNTGQWSNLYGTWMQLRDNSDDPNGYFMVVNASYEPGLFYSQEVPDLCPNTQYEFSIDIINIVRRNTAGHLPPNIDMLLNEQVILSTGNIAQDETWKTYSVSFCTGPLDTIMTLSIRNNAPGGIGNDLGIDNISFRPCGPLATILPADTSYVCLDDDIDPVVLMADISDPTFTAVQWQVSADQGATWQDLPGNDFTQEVVQFTSGAYLYRYVLATSLDNLQNSKCRVFSDTITLIAVPIRYEFADTICDGNSLTVGNSVYTQTGIYVDSLISSIGCDSIVTTNLTVVDQPQTIPELEITDPSCTGDPDGSVIVLDVPLATPPLTYMLNSMTNGNPGVFIGLNSGSYQVLVSDRYGCVYETEAEVNEPEKFVINTINDTVLTFGGGVILPTWANYNVATYQWRGDSGLSCFDCPAPFVIPPGTSTYIVEAVNEDGCSASDSVTLRVDRSDFPVFIPTGFTPNGDGKNDVFTIFAKSPGGIRQVVQFSVFNRWGNIIYNHSGGLSANGIVEWDGIGKLKPSPEGVYVFMLKVELIDHSIQYYSGSITLIR